jgi:hypothetical protein
MEARHKLAIVIGAAGSGKSSTIRHVLRQFAKHRKVIETDAADLGTLGAVRGIGFLFVDLNSIANTVAEMESRGVEQDACVGFVWDRVAVEFPVQIAARFGEELRDRGYQGDVAAVVPSLILDLVERGLDLCLGGVDTRTIVGGGVAAWLQPGFNELGGLLRPNKDVVLDYLRLTSIISKLGGDRPFLFWIAALHQLSGMPSRPRFFLVIDNIDPLSETIQKQVFSTILDATSKLDFQVVLPARFSTFDTPAATYSHPYCWYPHSGPSPLDIVSSRLLAFLSHPSNYPAFAKLSTDEEKRQAICRAYELLVRLHPGKHGGFAFGRMLRAVAGDSVRRGLIAARACFRSKLLSSAYNARAVSDVVIQSLRLGVTLTCGRFVRNVRDEMIAVAAESPDFRLQKSSPSAVADALAGRILATSVAIVSGFADTVSALGRLTEFDVAQLFHQSARHRGFLMAIAAATRAAMAVAVELGATADTADGVVTILAQRLDRESNIKVGETNWQVQASAELIRNMARAVRSAIPRVPSALQPVEDDMEAVISVVDPDNLTPTLSATNKYHIWPIALCNNSDVVVDLFHAGNGVSTSLSQIRLRALLLLRCMPGGRSRISEFVHVLRLRGFGEDAILDLFNTFVAPQHRIFWSSKAFKYKSYSEIESHADRPICLTRSGYGYCNVLMNEFNYVLAQLAGYRESSNLSLIDRLSQTLSALRELHELELVEAREARKHQPERPVGLYAQFLGKNANQFGALDVALRCTNEVRVLCERLFEQSRIAAAARIHGQQNVRNFCCDWANFLTASIQQVRDFCSGDPDLEGTSHPLYIARMLDIHQSIPKSLTRKRETKSVLSDLHGSLLGGALWDTSLRPDDFSPSSPGV